MTRARLYHTRAQRPQAFLREPTTKTRRNFNILNENQLKSDVTKRRVHQEQRFGVECKSVLILMEYERNTFDGDCWVNQNDK